MKELRQKSAQLLHEYEYVREFGEGVDRMYREMEEAGLPEPEYKTVAFMVHATIKNKKYLVDAKATNNQNVAQDVVQEHIKTLAEIIIAEIHKNEKVTREQIAEKAGVSKKTVTLEEKVTYEKIREYILEKHGLKVSTLCIAQIKDKCGLQKQLKFESTGENKVPQYTPKREEVIMEAFRHFGIV